MFFVVFQGMLSMSGTFSFGGSGAGDSRRSKTAGNIERLKARLAAKRGLLPGGAGQGKAVMGHQQDEEDEFEKALRNCRQDDDFSKFLSRSLHAFLIVRRRISTARYPG